MTGHRHRQTTSTSLKKKKKKKSFYSLDVLATCEVYFVLPHWDRSRNSSLLSTLSDESINRGLVWAHMHSIAQTQKILIFDLDE